MTDDDGEGFYIERQSKLRRQAFALEPDADKRTSKGACQQFKGRPA